MPVSSFCKYKQFAVSVAKPDNTQPDGIQAETVLGIAGVAASGVLGGLYGTALQEEKALQSIVSSVNHLQTCS